MLKYKHREFNCDISTKNRISFLFVSLEKVEFVRGGSQCSQSGSQMLHTYILNGERSGFKYVLRQSFVNKSHVCQYVECRICIDI